MIYIPHNIPNIDKGYGLAERAELKKVIEMFDPFGRPVTDPSQASRTITSYYDKEGKLVKRVLGKAMILRPDDENEEDGA
jgi:YD repeat-containing protein